jgi:hypothetical protein
VDIRPIEAEKVRNLETLGVGDPEARKTELAGEKTEPGGVELCVDAERVGAAALDGRKRAAMRRRSM